MTLSLLDLIKQKSQQKGRKLKLVVDWDDCLQPVRPLVVYQNSQISAPFKDFFQRFWENAILGATSDNTSEIGEWEGHLEEKQAVEEFEKKRKKSLKTGKHDFKGIEGFYNNNTWYTSFGKDLLKALKEDLIEEVLLISSLRKGLGKGKGGWFFINRDAEVVFKEKIDKFNKTFCKFPQTKVSLTQKTKDDKGKFGPQRWDVIKDNFPDFDIYVDDDWNFKIRETIQKMSSNKERTYLLPDYKKLQKARGSNVLKTKVTVSEITDREFALGALEYRLKKLEQGVHDLKPQTRPSSLLPIWLVSLYLTSGILVLFLTFGRSDKKKNPSHSPKIFKVR